MKDLFYEYNNLPIDLRIIEDYLNDAISPLDALKKEKERHIIEHERIMRDNLRVSELNRVKFEVVMWKYLSY